jgi:O-Antigen ligase
MYYGQKNSFRINLPRIGMLNIFRQGLLFTFCLSSVASIFQEGLLPLIPWIFFGLSFLSEFFVFKIKPKINFFLSSFSILMVIGVMLNSFLLEDIGYDFRQGLTFLALSFFGTLFFSSSHLLRRIFINSLIIFVAANALFLLGHWIFGLPSAYLGSPGRYATFISQPGNLGLSAFLTLFYALLRFLQDERVNVKMVSLLVVSIIVLIGENSRTLLLQIMLSLFLFFYLNREKLTFYIRSKFNYFLFGTVILLTSSIFFIPALLGSRAGNIVSQITQLNFSSIESEDETRFLMWNFVSSEIQANFLQGNGIGQTKIPLNVNGVAEMQVHAGAFQLWADAGLVAFIGYAGIIISSLFLGHSALKSSYLLKKDLVYIKLSVIYAWGFAFTNFLHTYSLVWAQWVYLAFTLGVIGYYSNARKS